MDLAIKTCSWCGFAHAILAVCRCVQGAFDKVTAVQGQVSCVKPCVEFSTCGRVEMIRALKAVHGWKTPRSTEPERSEVR